VLPFRASRGSRVQPADSNLCVGHTGWNRDADRRHRKHREAIMTDRSMDAVEVYVSKGPMVVIKQDSAMKQETSYITLHPDQVETVIQWLQQAKLEAMDAQHQQPTPA